MGLWDWVKSKFGTAVRPKLETGSRGADVKAWQVFVMKHDGIFGPITEAATRAWETVNGLPPAGVVTDMHWTIASKYQTGATVTDFTSLNRADYPTRHHWARAIILAAFKQAMGRAPTRNEAIFAQAVALGESSYGRGWKDAGVGSHNWGAVQAGRPPCNPATAFPYGDSHEDGSKYAACFRKYASDVDGAAHFIKIMFKPNVVEAAATGVVRNVSAGMRSNGYFELKLDQHVIGLTRHVKEITDALGEPMPSAGGGGAIGALLVAIPFVALIGFLRR